METEAEALPFPIAVPQEYRITNTIEEKISSPIPNQKPTTQVFVEVTKGDKKAYIFYWDGPVLRDLGRMVAAQSWKHKFLGEDASVSRATVFMGQEQEALVLHHKPDKDTQLMIYSKDMTKGEFHEMLNKISRK
jgi:hypothetical protein